MSQLTEKQSRIILHSLGASHHSTDLGWRNYYHTSEVDKQCEELVELGCMVRHGLFEPNIFYTVCLSSPLVIEALESYGNKNLKGFAVWVDGSPEIVSYYCDLTASKARYRAYLSLSDCLPDLQFRDLHVRRAPQMDARAKARPQASRLDT